MKISEQDHIAKVAQATSQCFHAVNRRLDKMEADFDQALESYGRIVQLLRRSVRLLLLLILLTWIWLPVLTCHLAGGAP